MVVWRPFYIAILAALFISFSADKAYSADNLQQSRTLFLSEKFSPTTIRGPLTDSSILPENVYALKGEREGFQTALYNGTGQSLYLAARLTWANDPGASVSVEFLRAGFVNVPKASTRVDSGVVAGAYKPGVYEDPLPPLRQDSLAGYLQIAPNNWGAVVGLFEIKTSATSGAYLGTLELFDPRDQTVYARQSMSLTIKNSTLRQNNSRKSFKTNMFVEGDAYWLQNKAMRNGPSAGYPSQPNRLLQLSGLMSFLDSRGITPLTMPYASPDKNGIYTCNYTNHPQVPAWSFIDQLKHRYFGPARSVSGEGQFQTRMFPATTEGCEPGNPNSAFNAKVDKYNTPGIKQDDFLHPNAGRFWTNAYSSWVNNGLFTQSTYVKNPFDEPTASNARGIVQLKTQVPKANELLHKATKGKAKVVLADWPRDSRKKTACRFVNGKKRCTTLSGDEFSTRYMWDGVGLNDVDVWMVPFSRMYGRTTPAILAPYKINRQREYATRLAGIKKLRGGREVWAYNFYTGNASQPQLVIDAPGTDPKMNYWLLAKEGHTGLFVSNTLLGWSSETSYNTGNTVRKGNPYEVTPYFQHGTYGQAAGWGTFIYPGYYPPLGLDSEMDRNSSDARPVTSLRMEGLRDGQEDANLILMYRERFGATKLDNLMRPIFPGTYKPLPKQLGQVMTLRYTNSLTMAQKMERSRRAMMNALG